MQCYEIISLYILCIETAVQNSRAVALWSLLIFLILNTVRATFENLTVCVPRPNYDIYAFVSVQQVDSRHCDMRASGYPVTRAS